MTSQIVTPRMVQNSNKQYFFQFLPLQLVFNNAESNEEFQECQYKFSIYKGGQKFGENKSSILREKSINILKFQRSYSLMFYLPAFNPHRKIGFALNLLACNINQQKFQTIDTFSIESNKYVNLFNQEQKNIYKQQIDFQNTKCKLIYQLYVQHSRQNIQKTIKQNHPQYYLNNKKQGSLSGGDKVYSLIDNKFNSTDKIISPKRFSRNYQEKQSKKFYTSNFDRSTKSFRLDKNLIKQGSEKISYQNLPKFQNIYFSQENKNIHHQSSIQFQKPRQQSQNIDIEIEAQILQSPNIQDNKQQININNQSKINNEYQIQEKQLIIENNKVEELIKKQQNYEQINSNPNINKLDNQGIQINKSQQNPIQQIQNLASQTVVQQKIQVQQPTIQEVIHSYQVVQIDCPAQKDQQIQTEQPQQQENKLKQYQAVEQIQIQSSIPIEQIVSQQKNDIDQILAQSLRQEQERQNLEQQTKQQQLNQQTKPIQQAVTINNYQLIDIQPQKKLINQSQLKKQNNKQQNDQQQVNQQPMKKINLTLTLNLKSNQPKNVEKNSQIIQQQYTRPLKFPNQQQISPDFSDSQEYEAMSPNKLVRMHSQQLDYGQRLKIIQSFQQSSSISFQKYGSQKQMQLLYKKTDSHIIQTQQDLKLAKLQRKKQEDRNKIKIGIFIIFVIIGLLFLSYQSLISTRNIKQTIKIKPIKKKIKK